MYSPFGAGRRVVGRDIFSESLGGTTTCVLGMNELKAPLGGGVVASSAGVVCEFEKEVAPITCSDHTLFDPFHQVSHHVKLGHRG
jgi:hypothetical protein